MAKVWIAPSHVGLVQVITIYTTDTDLAVLKRSLRIASGV